MKKITFISSLLTFYLKGEIVIDENFVWIKKPRRLWGFIPAGFDEWSVPIDQISSSGIYCMGVLNYLIQGVIIFFALTFAIPLLVNIPLAGLIFIVVGGIKISGSFYTGLSISTICTENNFDMFCPIFEKKKMEAANSKIHEMMERRRSDTNVRLQNKTLVAAQEAFTEAIINAINNKK